MKWIYGFLVVLMFSRFQCDGPMGNGGCETMDCVKATVKALNLDGCQFALDLSDGTRLIPEKRVYVQAPKKEDDPAYYFNFVDGTEVCIQYTNSNVANACMAGQTVFLTQIEVYSSLKGSH